MTSLFGSNPPPEGPHYQQWEYFFLIARLRLFNYLVSFFHFFPGYVCFLVRTINPDSAVLAHSTSLRMLPSPSCWSVDSSACLYTQTKLTYLFIYNISFHSLLPGVSFLYTMIHSSYTLNLQAPCVLYMRQAFPYSPENAFYVFNQQIYLIN